VTVRNVEQTDFFSELFMHYVQVCPKLYGLRPHQKAEIRKQKSEIRAQKAVGASSACPLMYVQLSVTVIHDQTICSGK